MSSLPFTHNQSSSSSSQALTGYTINHSQLSSAASSQSVDAASFVAASAPESAPSRSGDVAVKTESDCPILTPQQNISRADSDVEGGVSGFIRKTFNMVSDDSTSDIVSWDERGEAFIVKKEFEFASLVLPKYFRHKNFSSFVRQLNFYGFQKRSHQAKFTKFHHPSFRRGQPAQLSAIKRKSTEANANFKDNIAALTAEVTDLKRQYDDLFNIQQQILYIFARYLRAYPLPARIVDEPTQQPLLADDEPAHKRQRLLMEPLSPARLSPTLRVRHDEPFMQPISSAHLNAAHMSSSSAMFDTHSSSLSNDQRELAELTALQDALHTMPGGQAILTSNIDLQPLNTIQQHLTAQQTALLHAGGSSAAQSAQSVAALLARGPLPPISQLAALSGQSHGPLSNLNPATLSALNTLSNIANAATQRFAQKSHSSSSASTSYTSSTSAEQTPPMSADQLLQLLQRAHPTNRASRLDEIRAEQRADDDDHEVEFVDEQMRYDKPRTNSPPPPHRSLVLPNVQQSIPNSNWSALPMSTRSALDVGMSKDLYPSTANIDPSLLQSNIAHIVSRAQTSATLPVMTSTSAPTHNPPPPVAVLASSGAHLAAVQAGAEAYLASRFQSIVNASKNYPQPTHYSSTAQTTPTPASYHYQYNTPSQPLYAQAAQPSPPPPSFPYTAHVDERSKHTAYFDDGSVGVAVGSDSGRAAYYTPQQHNPYVRPVSPVTYQHVTTQERMQTAAQQHTAIMHAMPMHMTQPQMQQTVAQALPHHSRTHAIPSVASAHNPAMQQARHDYSALTQYNNTQ